MDVKKTFLELTTKTYPYGYEDMLECHLPVGTKKDRHGNYYYRIGNSDTIFTCHLDTASKTHVGVRHVFDLNYIRTDGTSILGADDKAGMTVLLFMIARRVPGLYYFFIGEECGCVGSRAAAKDKADFAGYRRMISFDRRGTTSVITHQSSLRTCSEKFARSLSAKLSVNGMLFRPDDTGVYTDSAEFATLIPECTNVSVGYNKEHTHQESQNIEFLERLCEACATIDFDSLPVDRDPTKYEYKSYDYGSAYGRQSGGYYHDTYYGADTRRKRKGRRGGTVHYPTRRNDAYNSHEDYPTDDFYWVEGRKVYYSDHSAKPRGLPTIDRRRGPDGVDKYTAIRDMYLSGDLTQEEMRVIKEDFLDMSETEDREFYDYLTGLF